MTQNERVYASLVKAGSRGITQADWSGAFRPTPDNGPPITRVAACIYNLKKDGFSIVEAGRREKCRVYVLKPSTIEQVIEQEPDALFDTAIDRTMSAITGEDLD